MKYSKEISLDRFEAWQGAVGTLDIVREHGKIQELEYMIEELFCDSTPTETAINDFLWFDYDSILESLGIEQ